MCPIRRNSIFVHVAYPKCLGQMAQLLLLLLFFSSIFFCPPLFMKIRGANLTSLPTCHELTAESQIKLEVNLTISHAKSHDLWSLISSSDYHLLNGESLYFPNLSVRIMTRIHHEGSQLMSDLTVFFSRSVLSPSQIHVFFILIDGVCLELGEFYGL